jgi:hypothetical protein
MNPAHAGLADTLKSTLVKKFIDIIEEVQQPPVRGEGNQIANAFTEALDALDVAKKEGVDYIGDIQYLPKTLKSLVNIESVFGVETLRRLRNYEGLTSLSGKPTVPEFIDKLGEIDFAELTPEQIKGIQKSLNNLGSKDGTSFPFTSSNGASHELLDIFKNIDSIVDIQKDEVIGRLKGKALNRVYDYTLKVGNDIVYVDKKAWAPDTIKKWLAKSADADFLIPGEEKTGQLFRDLVAAADGKKMRWSFDARAGTAYTPGQIKAIVRNGLEKNIKSIKSVAGKPNVPNKDFIDDVMKNFDIEISDI